MTTLPAAREPETSRDPPEDAKRQKYDHRNETPWPTPHVPLHAAAVAHGVALGSGATRSPFAQPRRDDAKRARVDRVGIFVTINVNGLRKGKKADSVIEFVKALEESTRRTVFAVGITETKMKNGTTAVRLPGFYPAASYGRNGGGGGVATWGWVQ